MRYILGLLFSLAATPFSNAHEQSVLARVTVYWASGGSGSDHWSRQHIASSGARLRAGHCAVDPRRIPYGSRVVLPDGPLVAVDTGSAVRSRRAARLAGRSASEKSALVIDRFFETKGQALSWASRNPQFMTVKVQSPNESLTTVRTGVANTSTIRTATTKSPATQRIASTPPASSASLRRNAVATAPALGAADDPQKELLAQYNAEEPRSHYGRKVAYLR